jgi:hypothetical protein
VDRAVEARYDATAPGHADRRSSMPSTPARDAVATCAFLALIAVLACGFGPVRGALADEPPAAPEAPAEGQPAEAPADLREATADEAKSLLAALKKVYKKKNANDVLPALEPMAELKHESWDKALVRLLKHDSSLVAMRVAEMWCHRVTDKNLKKVWKAGWQEKRNDKRFTIKTKVLRAVGIAGHILDAKQYKAVEKDWRWMVGNPNESYSDALIDICWYFEVTKDKRHCRHMAEQLDEPGTNVVNDGNNPPADWWERKWKMWKPMKPAAVAALKAITGQEFDKTAVAKKWFEDNEKTFGFDW